VPADPRLSGSPRRGVVSRFRLQRPLPRPTVLRLLRNGFIPSCRSSPSEFLRRSSRPLLSERTVLPGFHPSSRRHRRCLLGAGGPSSRYVPPSGFLSLSTVCSTFDFAGLFHPAATSRVMRPFRGFSRSAAVPTRRRALPPCRCRPPAHRQAGCHGRAPRLRGFALRSDAFLGAGIGRSFDRSPLRVSASSRRWRSIVSRAHPVIRS
jgi:hypothetical protein